MPGGCNSFAVGLEPAVCSYAEAATVLEACSSVAAVLAACNSSAVVLAV